MVTWYFGAISNRATMFAVLNGSVIATIDIEDIKTPEAMRFARLKCEREIASRG